MQAHDHLDRAQALFTTLKDSVNLAQTDETRARVLLAEGRIAEAEKMVRAAVQTLERGGEQSLLAEALTTHGIALARLRDLDQARATFQRAVDVAEQAGDPEGAGQASLVLVEHLGSHLSNDDLYLAVQRAGRLLENSQDMDALRRLGRSACRILSLIHDHPCSLDWTNFSFKRAVLHYESELISLALKEAGGSVTKAAHLLGFGHHQSLLAMLNNRHKNLRDIRKPVRRRRRSIFRRLDPVEIKNKSGSPGAEK